MSLEDEINRTKLRGVTSFKVAVRKAEPEGIILVLDHFEVPTKPGLSTARTAVLLVDNQAEDLWVLLGQTLHKAAPDRKTDG